MSDIRELKSLKEATLSIDEGSGYWSISMELSDPGEFANLSPSDKFVLNLYDEEFHFYVDSGSLNKSSPTELVGAVQGVGLGADRDFPRSEKITKTWAGKTAREIVEELLGADRIDAWDFIDWPVPDNKFAVSDGSRLEAAKTLVAVGGGVVEGTPEGNFVVRHRHPVAPWKYATTPEDKLFDEQTSLLSIKFDYSISQYLDQVRVTDTAENDYADVVETEMDPDEMGAIIRVYPHPWREDVILTTTGNSEAIVISEIGIVERSETETIEIVKGEGSLKYPVVSLDELKWKYLPLLNLCNEYYSTKVCTGRTDEYSLVEVRYTTKSINFRVTSTVKDTAQFLVKSPIVT